MKLETSNCVRRLLLVAVFGMASGIAAAQQPAASQPVSATPAAAAAGAADSGSATKPAPEKAVSVKPTPEKAAAVEPEKAVVNGYAEQLKAVPAPKGARHAKAVKAYAPITPPKDQYTTLEVDMYVGESRVFNTPNIGRIAVGNGGIMTAAALDDKEVIVFANGVGTSSLFVWSKDGRYQRIKINIIAGDTSRIQREVAAFLSQIPNAKASVVGDKVIVEGENMSDADLRKIAKLGESYPQMINFTAQIGWEKMIMMDVKVVEFPSSALRNLGLRWGNPLGAVQAGALWYPAQRRGGFTIETPDSQFKGRQGQDLVLPAGLAGTIGMNLMLNAQLDLMAQNGDAVVLASPMLSTRNGSKATFGAGGEIPYQGIGPDGVAYINFKKYGVELNIQPFADKTGTIRADIDTKVSAIDPSVSSAAGPALRTRETKTTFNVKDGETLVLSGFISREQSKDIDKIPGLGDLPVLGALFRSTRFVNKETELVIFVTPSIVTGQSPGLKDRIQRTNERLEKTLGPQPYLTKPIQPGTDTSKPNGPGGEHAPVSPPSAIASSEQNEQGVITTTVAAPAVQLSRAPQAGAESPPEMPSFTANRAAAAAMPRYVVQLDGLAMRRSPDVNAAPLLHLSKGMEVDKLPQLEQSHWTAVQLGATRGWVATRWLRLVRE